MMENRRTGAVGALLDEYERVLNELKVVLMRIGPEKFIFQFDPQTSDPDCKSVRSILNHVVRSGYGYSNTIRKQFGDDWTRRKKNYELSTSAVACTALDEMFEYCEATLANKGHFGYKEIIANPMTVSWGQTFDFEQMMEHAIVHVMRHRRQIEGWGL